jgi:hypothetical protein
LFEVGIGMVLTPSAGTALTGLPGIFTGKNGTRFSDPALTALFEKAAQAGDVAVQKDGSLLISDDFAGAIYRVTYSAP